MVSSVRIEVSQARPAQGSACLLPSLLPTLTVTKLIHHQSHLLSLELGSPLLTALVVLFPPSGPKEGTAPQRRPAADSPNVETAIETGRSVADIESCKSQAQSQHMGTGPATCQSRDGRTKTCGDGWTSGREMLGADRSASYRLGMRGPVSARAS